MGFWIRSYKIQLEKLPVSLVTWSSIVVFGCAGILSSILLLLPIQDKIKGDVQIFTKGQPLNMMAPSAGFLYFHKGEQEYVGKGELLATIDVEITEQQLDQLEEFVYNELKSVDLGNTNALISRIDAISRSDFRQVNNELLNLSDQLKQLEILIGASDPRGLLNNLDRSISLKVKQLGNYSALNQSELGVLQLMKEQLASDSILLAAGAISEREFQETKRKLIDKQSVLIENDLRRQNLSGDIIDEQKEKNKLQQNYKSNIEELNLRIITQTGIIRKKYQEYLDEFVIKSSTSGYVYMPVNIVNQEAVDQGDLVMLLTKTQNTTQAISEMFVNANNAGKIEVGMNVRVGLSEFDQKEFGIYYTTVKDVSPLQVDGRYKITLNCELPLTTSYNVQLPGRNTYSGNGEILIGKINLLEKISREIQFNRDKYASL